MSTNNTTVNQELCIGCGTCVSLCPRYYRMTSDDTKAEVREDHSIEESTVLDETIQACPVGAISWTSTDATSS